MLDKDYTYTLIETKLHRLPVPTDLVPSERLAVWLNQRLQRPLFYVYAFLIGKHKIEDISVLIS